MMTWHDLTPSGWRSTLEKTNYSYLDIFYVFACAVLWTLSRVFLNKTIFQKLIGSLEMKSQAAKSLPESLWKLLIYLAAWLVSAQLVLNKYRLFQNPAYGLINWNINATVPMDIYLVYLGQISFYVHSIYATLFLDKRRKDSVVLLAHHFVAIVLIGGSYSFRYMYLGMLVFFLHDISDVALELTKIFVYLKSKGGKWSAPCDVASSFGFVAFGTSWFVFRLYWFPLKVIYVTTHISRILYSDAILPFFLPINILLTVLLILHAYWFKLIVEMAVKILRGKAKQVEDLRDYDDSQLHVTNKLCGQKACFSKHRSHKSYRNCS